MTSDTIHYCAKIGFAIAAFAALGFALFHPEMETRVVAGLALVAGVLGLHVNLPGFTAAPGDDSPPKEPPSVAAPFLLAAMVCGAGGSAFAQGTPPPGVTWTTAYV